MRVWTGSFTRTTSLFKNVHKPFRRLACLQKLPAALRRDFMYAQSR